MSVPAGTLGDMTQPIPPNGERDLSRALAVRSDEQLLERVSALIEQTRTLVARQTNVALTLLYWEIGRLIDVEVLKQERADYARRIVGSLAPQLTARFGRGFDQSNLHRMIKLSQVFPDREIVGSLAPSHDASAGANRRGAHLLHRSGHRGSA